MKERPQTNGNLIPIQASTQSICFACGQENPHGLRLHFCTAQAGESAAEWTPTSFMEGFRGIVHGGIVSTVLDEAMSKAVAAAGLRALTAELRVRLRHHVPPQRQVQVRGWITGQSKRLIKTEAAIMDAEGSELAHGWASFLTVEGLASPELQREPCGPTTIRAASSLSLPLDR
jgi:acyl-coenzyme A thioesterase PaaI-like protein